MKQFRIKFNKVGRASMTWSQSYRFPFNSQEIVSMIRARGATRSFDIVIEYDPSAATGEVFIDCQPSGTFSIEAI